MYGRRPLKYANTWKDMAGKDDVPKKNNKRNARQRGK